MRADPPSVEEFAPRTKPLRLSVVDVGYAGVVSAACLAALGHQVTLVEIERSRLHALRCGALPGREVVFGTERPEFLASEWDQAAAHRRGTAFLDARSVPDPAVVRIAGLTYHALGRAVVDSPRESVCAC